MGLRVSPSVNIPDSEIRLTAVRSSGPGGQNVNKVNTCIILEFDLKKSAAFSERQKQRMCASLGHRVNREGVMRIHAQRHRTQSANREEAISKFIHLIRQSLKPVKYRVPTHVPGRVREQRITEKKKRADVKQVRKKIRNVDE